MHRLVAELGRPVVLSDRALRQLARVKNAHRLYVQAEGREPSFDSPTRFVARRYLRRNSERFSGAL
jgi:hypothetical protein